MLYWPEAGDCFEMNSRTLYNTVIQNTTRSWRLLLLPKHASLPRYGKIIKVCVSMWCVCRMSPNKMIRCMKEYCWFLVNMDHSSHFGIHQVCGSIKKVTISTLNTVLQPLILIQLLLQYLFYDKTKTYFMTKQIDEWIINHILIPFWWWLRIEENVS